MKIAPIAPLMKNVPPRRYLDDAPYEAGAVVAQHAYTAVGLVDAPQPPFP